jgi:hypothetical protein
MPLGKGVRYRVKTMKGGKRVRLAFKGSQVVEAKNIDTGATHTPSEFAAERKGRKRGKKKKQKKAVSKTAVARFRSRLANLRSKRKK